MNNHDMLEDEEQKHTTVGVGAGAGAGKLGHEAGDGKGGSDDEEDFSLKFPKEYHSKTL